MEHAKAKVIDAEIQRDEYRFHRKKALWTQLGDKCNKEFFEAVKQKNSAPEFHSYKGKMEL